MSEPCRNCPCPDVCLRRPKWCDRMAADPPPGPVEVRSICERSRIEHAKSAYPSLLEQGGNLAAAAGRVVAAVARGEPVLVPAEVVAERRALCLACEHRDAKKDRCRKCGCFGLKLDLATERCPLDPPRWDRLTASSTPPP